MRAPPRPIQSRHFCRLHARDTSLIRWVLMVKYNGDFRSSTVSILHQLADVKQLSFHNVLTTELASQQHAFDTQTRSIATDVLTSRARCVRVLVTLASHYLVSALKKKLLDRSRCHLRRGQIRVSPRNHLLCGIRGCHMANTIEQYVLRGITSGMGSQDPLTFWKRGMDPHFL